MILLQQSRHVIISVLSSFKKKNNKNYQLKIFDENFNQASSSNLVQY